MNKQIKKEGYVVFSPDGKMLRNYWVGGSQTGTNKQSLTTDITKATLFEDESAAQLSIVWFNASHKKQIDFIVKPATLISTFELRVS